MTVAGKLERNLFATDFSAVSFHSLPYALPLAERNRGHLMLPYVDTAQVTADRIMEAHVDRMLIDMVPRAAAGARTIETIIEIGPTADKIVEVGATNHSDVIVMGLPERRGCQSSPTWLLKPTARY